MAYFVRGVHQDLPDGLTDDILAWVDKFPTIADLETLTNNRIFKQRTVDIGVLSTEEALDLGMSGPVLRATGHAWDFARHSLMIVMLRWILIFRSAPPGIVMPGIWCGLKR